MDKHQIPADVTVVYLSLAMNIASSMNVSLYEAADALGKLAAIETSKGENFGRQTSD